MKFKFESNLKHQEEAVNSIVDIFEGIATKEGLFSMSRSGLSFDKNTNIGISNQITTIDWKIEICQQNLHRIQKENGLINSNINFEMPTFDVEMETGTGKTYVFLKTILKLSNKYNFKKFIIVVPSIAIKEGIKKTLQITKEHFNSLFPGIKYNYYEYNSNSLETLIWNFSNSDDIEIMIMNIQQMNKMSGNDKNTNVLYKEFDLLGGHKAIDLIKETNPIIIIDEPQSTTSGKTSVEAIKNLNPLFVLRYSATFRKRKNENLVYKLDPVDAYNKKLVKEIVVYSKEVTNENNSQTLIRVHDLDIKNQSAKISIKRSSSKDKQITWTKVNVEFESNLYIASKKLSEYEGIFIEEIDFVNGKIILSNGEEYFKGSSLKGYDIELKTSQIRETIKLHLEKQYKLKDRGIKVLSLFFIDKVDKYRIYDENKNPLLGEYAKIFEEEFILFLKTNKKYWELFNIKDESQIEEIAKEVQDGYFSIDSKNKLKDTKGETKDDTSTYIKIMKDKEKLLSFSEKLCFIFSHSALKEGWDNPNVFQICTLNDSKSEIKKRQEIGRGLRLCVDQKGNRVYDEYINQLSIITSNTHEEFVEKLQKELKEDGFVFGVFEPHTFSNEIEGMEKKESEKLFELLRKKEYINSKGKINRNVSYEEIKEELHQFVIEIFSNPTNEKIQSLDDFMKQSWRELNIKNGNKKVKNNIKKEVINSKEFINLWNAINQKTTYNFHFNTKEYIKEVKMVIKENLNNHLKTKIISSKSKIEKLTFEGIKLKKQGIINEEIIDSTIVKQWIPDIVSDIEKATSITRRTIIEILSDDEIIEYIKKYHEKIKNIVIKAMNEIKTKMMVEGIEYKKIEDYYSQENFIKNNEPEIDPSTQNDSIIEIDKSSTKYPYEYVVVDSKVEKEFAKNSIDADIVVKFVKLPSWFKVPTPLGEYNPDWAIYKKDYMAFVAETKGSNDMSQLRESEEFKYICGKKHFESIGTKIILGKDFDEIIKKS